MPLLCRIPTSIQAGSRASRCASMFPFPSVVSCITALRQGYLGHVEVILDSTISTLYSNPQYTFVWSEISFLSHWYTKREGQAAKQLGAQKQSSIRPILFDSPMSPVRCNLAPSIADCVGKRSVGICWCRMVRVLELRNKTLSSNLVSDV